MTATIEINTILGNEASETFPNVLSQSSYSIDISFEKTIAAIKKIESMPNSKLSGGSSSSGEKNRTESLEQVVDAYIVSEISKQYPLISDSLTQARRYVLLEFFGSECEIIKECRQNPAKTSLKKDGKHYRWVSGSLLMSTENAISNRFRYNDNIFDFGRVTWPLSNGNQAVVKARFPGGATPEHQRHVDKLMAVVHETIGTLLRNEFTAPIVRSWSDYDSRADVVGLWIPTLESMFVEEEPDPTKDPALSVRFRDRLYLACMWDSPGEDSLDNLMREFTIGGKIKS